MSKKQVGGYILEERIGKGSYASVWKGRMEGSGDPVAVKVISRQTVTETAQLRQEVDVLRRISHPNIVRFQDLKKSAAHFYLVLEYCAGGDLSQFLREKGHVGETSARHFLTQIGAGLCALHRGNVLHRDLKPQNILLSDSSDTPTLKIADFGFARALLPQDMAATVCGSPLYMAPEILRHERYDAKADLWSVGAIMYELLLGRPPFTGANPMQLLANIERSERISFDGVTVSSEGQDFLRAMLKRSPAERLNSREFSSHAYVRLEAPFGTEDNFLPGEWYVPPCRADTGLPSAMRRDDRSPHPPSSGVASPVGLGSPMTQSPVPSPRESTQDGILFELSLQTSPTNADDALCTHDSPAAHDARDASAANACDGPDDTPVSPASRAEGATPAGWFAPTPTRGPSRGADDEFIVVKQQHISGFTRGRGPTPRAAASDFCKNLSRIAHGLEQLATRLREQAPSDALALLLRALGLLEKALNVSIAEADTVAHLKTAFRRMFDEAEAVAQALRAPTSARAEPARPSAAIVEFAVQQARDAAVLMSKGREEVGWEAGCHDKLTLALLLLDLLGSEADGEDLATITSYTAPIARLVGAIEQRLGTIDRASAGIPD